MAGFPRIASLPREGKTKRRPTPPRCARQPLPREGASVDTPSLLPMEGGAPKGRRVDGGSGMKESGKIVSSRQFTKAPERRCAVPLPQWGRQRGGGFAAKKEKPTPPRCARQPLPREGAREVIPSFLWKEVPRRGGGWMGMPLSPKQSLPRVGKVARGASRIGFWRYEREGKTIVSSAPFARAPYPPLTRSPFPAWGRWRAERAG